MKPFCHGGMIALSLLLNLGSLRGAWAEKPAAVPGREITVKDGVKHFGPAWLRQEQGIYFLYVEGSDYDRAFQHGVLLREEIQAGMIPYLAGYFHREIEHSVIGGSPTLVKLAEGFINHSVFDSISRRIPPEQEAALRGLADGSGIAETTLRRLMVFPDAGQVIEGKVYGRFRIYPDLAGMGDGGCTSFAASGPATADGHLLHGRNLDFPGMGYYEKFPLVILVQPDQGQRYVMLTTAGLHSVPTAMNESGITIGFHTAITADVSLFGWPILPLSEMVVRQARSLEDAIAILAAHPTAAGWIAVISDAKAGAAVAVELSRHHQAVIRMTNHSLSVSNRYRSPVMTPDEISVNWSYPINFLARQKRMDQLLAENYGRIDPQKGAEFLSDHWDINTGRSRATGDAIAQYHNLQSVVVDATAGNFWLALGPAPVCNNRYGGFNFEDGFAGKFPPLPDLHGTWEKDPRLEGLHRLIQAGDQYSLRDDFAGAVAELEAAFALDPAEPIYAQLIGLLDLRRQQPEAAVPWFERALALPQTAHKQSLAHLWLARSYDLLDEREPALSEYQKVLEFSPLDPRVKQAAEAGMKRPYAREAAKKISIDFGSGDSYGY